MSFYLAAYDISLSGRRARVARVLHRYGHRVQRSVFEIWVEPEGLPDLRRELGSILSRVDAFDLYPIDTRDPGRRLRWQRPPRVREAVILL